MTSRRHSIRLFSGKAGPQPILFRLSAYMGGRRAIRYIGVPYREMLRERRSLLIEDGQILCRCPERMIKGDGPARKPSGGRAPNIALTVAALQESKRELRQRPLRAAQRWGQLLGHGRIGPHAC